jgi:hypothetical protein
LRDQTIVSQTPYIKHYDIKQFIPDYQTFVFNIGHLLPICLWFCVKIIRHIMANILDKRWFGRYNARWFGGYEGLGKRWFGVGHYGPFCLKCSITH